MKCISIHAKHDSNLTISYDNEIKIILELERLFNKRYFESSYNPVIFEEQWKEALEYCYEYVGFNEFDLAATSWVTASQEKVLKSLINSNVWVNTTHHVAHATAAYFTSDFKNPLILSYDGGGNDGTLNLYRIDDKQTRLIDKKPINMGSSYRLLATIMPEITHRETQQRKCGNLSLSGKLMGYAALGDVVPHWIEPLKGYYYNFKSPEQSLNDLTKSLFSNQDECVELPDKIARDLAASAQKAYEEVVLEIIENYITQANYDGIIITGGCALNVLTNSRIHEKFKLPVHVPPNPNDSGISIGALWHHCPPDGREVITYKGIPAINDLSGKHKELFDLARSANLEDIANLLLKGAVIGVLRGRSEVGPRALGNRSIIAYPNSIELKDKLNNKIKFREWFRPFAPIVPLEWSTTFLGKEFASPYMSFSFQLQDYIKNQFPAIAHLDGTSRVQTIEREQNPWIHDLLMKIKELGGYPILLNTSFNIKGKPLITRYTDAFEILKETSLSHILVEDKLVQKSEVE